ncbi:hypothetical protein AB3N04_00405 (plasmid) [Alkalihalophilus sp. As8PL]|uniref:Uncharacterized protein n=1 Tax=Alkalihalophilus sp. As8PL TaxID=3237103 RepID=A0AB39BN44_9BACI
MVEENNRLLNEWVHCNHNLGWSARKIAKEYGCGHSTVSRSFQNNGYELRKHHNTSFVDLSYKRFGLLTVIRPLRSDTKGSTIWECTCYCQPDKTLEVHTYDLRKRNKTHCGCKFKGKHDLMHKRFGSLTAIKELPERKNGFVVWHCLCDCKNTKQVTSHDLLRKSVQSCGCNKSRSLIGVQFGLLTVIGMTPKRLHGYKVWNCKCECGREIDIATNQLSRQQIQSCGCSS